ncbi:MAG: hypothetical protein K2K05_11895 [Muribaculaceae bacterium]|nr:hypothetical protein [Muribaculaceae bacterium]
MVTDIIASVHPEADLNDEEVLFGIICDDYEKYADLISSREEDIARAVSEGEERALSARDRQQWQSPTDGVPALGGATLSDPKASGTIFDLAAMA